MKRIEQIRLLADSAAMSSLFFLGCKDGLVYIQKEDSIHEPEWTNVS